MDNTNKIQELRERYKNSFVEKAEVLVEFLQILSDHTHSPISTASGSDKVCVEIHEYMHKLAGSSGMYDYSDIARLSRAAMQSSLQNEVQLLSEQLSELRDLLQQYGNE